MAKKQAASAAAWRINQRRVIIIDGEEGGKT